MKQSNVLAAALVVAALFGGDPICAGAEPKKQTVAEARAQFETADKVLNYTYDVARKKLSKPKFEQLREEQRIWLGFREELALTPSYSGVSADPAAAKRSAEYFGALLELTKERDEWITQAWIAGMLDGEYDDALTAVWRDRHGGLMETIEQGDKLLFMIHVVRGRVPQVDAIAGTAQWVDRIGWFTDKGRDPNKKDVTTLAFVSRDRKELEVISGKSDGSEGDSANFDGNYIKVGRLSKEAIAKLLKAAESGVILD